MRALAEADLLAVWEGGRHANPEQRAWLLLQRAQPQIDIGELRLWSLGKRDRLLLSLRGSTFGEEIACLLDCPECGTTLELARDLAALGADLPEPPPTATRELHVGDLRCELRAPTCAMAERAWNALDAGEAEAYLRSECVRIVSGAAAPEAHSLEPAQWRQLDEALRQLDPWADLGIDVACAECGHEWRAPFDISRYLWDEVSQRARRILEQVHRLARAYGWSQDAILELGPLRRQSYLDCLSRDDGALP